MAVYVGERSVAEGFRLIVEKFWVVAERHKAEAPQDRQDRLRTPQNTSKIRPKTRQKLRVSQKLNQNACFGDKNSIKFANLYIIARDTLLRSGAPS